ncbi:Zn-finger, CCHC type [Scheffersomyces xylosifermentans]|uniref:Zn-finger, CCHC type n=1 Tax=Scheffersomyces xylosifermentans TaxID=1304137 RepID=UPI00315D24E7
MSTIELSKTVDDLAKVIANKNKELEELKQDYDEKMHILSNYLSKLQEVIGTTANGEEWDIDEESLLKSLTLPMKCPSCNTSIVSNEEDFEYIRIPKKRIRRSPHYNTNLGSSKSVSSIESAGDYLTGDRGQESKTTRPASTNKIHQKSKKVCSYCNKPGHSRAKCFLRLSTPPS